MKMLMIIIKIVVILLTLYQVSFVITSKEGRTQVPLAFVKYRIDIILDKVDLVEGIEVDDHE